MAILDLSREVSTRLALFDSCQLRLDLLPQWNREKLSHILLGMIHTQSDKPLSLWLQGLLNHKLISIVIKQSKSTIQTSHQLNRKEINKLVHSIKNLKLSISDTKGFTGAEASTGGVDTTEINPLTMESLKVKNLFFAGEILDVDGDRGDLTFILHGYVD
ncbi:MAG: NAD(P)/FAD-dependent oxidoreductase [Sulfurovum sp.]|nr:NAD(P)/FAD-dependent oxidoreductase [Sulfurovum sp.]